MPQSVKLSDELIKQARHYGDVYHRSTAKQIEYWSTIGKISEENPDLPYSFIKEILIAQREVLSVMCHHTNLDKTCMFSSLGSLRKPLRNYTPTRRQIWKRQYSCSFRTHSLVILSLEIVVMSEPPNLKW